MIHGFGGSFIKWNKPRDRMNTEYRVMRVDLPGFGLSDLPEPEGPKTDYVQQTCLSADRAAGTYRVTRCNRATVGIFFADPHPLAVRLRAAWQDLCRLAVL